MQISQIKISLNVGTYQSAIRGSVFAMQAVEIQESSTSGMRSLNVSSICTRWRGARADAH